MRYTLVASIGPCNEEKKTSQDSGNNLYPLVNETVDAYELLRDQCVAHQSTPSAELGLSVLLRNGMLAWTRAYSRLVSSERTYSVASAEVLPVAPSRNSLIDIMVAMVTGVSRVKHSDNGGVKA